MNNVVITGYASISGLGTNNREFRENYLNNCSGLKSNEKLSDQKGEPVTTGHITDFTYQREAFPRSAGVRDRSSKLALTASKEAIEQCGIGEIIKNNPDSVGILAANTYVGAHNIWNNIITYHEKGPNFVTPFASQYGNYTVLSNVCNEFQIAGYNNTINSSSSSGHSAIKIAVDRIQLGLEKIMILVAIDPLEATIHEAAEKCDYLSPTGQYHGPFDKNRSGMVLGEACGILILENEEHAKQRGTNIFGKISGIGIGTEELSKEEQHGEGIQKAMRNALTNANMEPGTLDFIHTSSNGSKTMDSIEASGIKTLQESTDKPIAIAALKSIIGETFSSAGVMSVIAGLETINNDYLASIHHTDQVPDSFSDLHFAIEPVANRPLKAGLCNSVGTAGDCYSILITNE